MALDPSTVDALRDHRRHQLEERIAAGPAWQDELADDLGTSRTGLVFTWEDGSLIHPERLSAWFRRHCVEAGLPPIRLHDVRHSYASAGLANATGWHEAKIISERLGYANVAITIDTDSHVLPAAGAETAHTLAKLILGGFDVYVSKPRSRRHGQRMPFSRSAWSAVDSRPTRAWRKRQTRWVQVPLPGVTRSPGPCPETPSDQGQRGSSVPFGDGRSRPVPPLACPIRVRT
jgi:hypothetical protein